MGWQIFANRLTLRSGFQCLPTDVLAVYSIEEQSRLGEQGLRELCPIMLQQLDTGTCRTHNKDQLSGDVSPRPSDAEGQHCPVVDKSYKMLLLIC